MRNRLVRRMAVATILTVTLWAAPAAASSTSALVGDSLLGQTADEVQPLLREQGWNVVIQYVGGSGLTDSTYARRMGVLWDWQVALERIEARHDPAAVVIILGTNDVDAVARGESYAVHIDRMLSATDAPVVLWADCSSQTADPDRNAACLTIHAEIVAAADRRPGVDVLPYDERVASELDNVDADGIHLSQAGQDAFAALIAEALGRAPEEEEVEPVEPDPTTTTTSPPDTTTTTSPPDDESSTTSTSTPTEEPAPEPK